MEEGKIETIQEKLNRLEERIIVLQQYIKKLEDENASLMKKYKYEFS